MTKSVDVLFLSHRYEVVSGGEKALLDMIEYLTSININAHVIIGGPGNIIDSLKKWGVPYTIVHLPFWAHGGEDLSPFVFNQPLSPTRNTTLEIVKLIESMRPKICVTNTIVVPWLAYAAAMTNTPHSWMIHELDASGLELHFAIGKTQILRTVDLLSDKIFFNSRFTASQYLPRLTFNKDPSVIYPVGTASLDNKKSDSPFSTSGAKIICVGQIKPQKGQIDLVRAASVMKDKGLDFEILLVGGTSEDDRPYLESLKNIIEGKGLRENIIFFGHSDNPTGLMRTADIAINCATNESFGRVTVEAMLSNIPVIGAASAGTTEIIKPGKTGLLYEPGDHNALASQILRLYKDTALAIRLPKNALESARHIYSDTERYRPFVEYLNSHPSRTSLDLTPLNSILLDFRSAIKPTKRSRTSIANVPAYAKKIARRLLKSRSGT